MTSEGLVSFDCTISGGDAYPADVLDSETISGFVSYVSERLEDDLEHEYDVVAECDDVNLVATVRIDEEELSAATATIIQSAVRESALELLSSEIGDVTIDVEIPEELDEAITQSRYQIGTGNYNADRVLECLAKIDDRHRDQGAAFSQSILDTMEGGASILFALDSSFEGDSEEIIQGTCKEYLGEKPKFD